MLWYIQSWFLWSRFDGGFILHVCFAIFWHQKREENSITHHISPLLTPSQLGCACAMLSPHPYHSEETKNRTAFFSDVVFMQLFRRFLAAFWHVSFCQQPVGNLQETCGKLIRNPILRGAVVEVWWFFYQKTPSNLHQSCIKTAPHVSSFSKINQEPNFSRPPTPCYFKNWWNKTFISHTPQTTT